MISNRADGKCYEERQWGMGVCCAGDCGQRRPAEVGSWSNLKKRVAGSQAEGTASGISTDALKQECLLVPWRLNWPQWLEEGEGEESPGWVEKGKDRKGSVQMGACGCSIFGSQYEMGALECFLQRSSCPDFHFSRTPDCSVEKRSWEAKVDARETNYKVAAVRDVRTA